MVAALVIGPAGTAVADPGLGDGGPIMPLSQVQPGMQCTGETVVQGTTISSFDVQVISVVDQPGEGPRILIRVSGPAVDQSGIAEGFSGSPVYCPDSTGTPENIGAISEGVGQYGNQVGLATPIQQMLGEPVLPPSSAAVLRAKARPLLGPLTVAGLSPAFMNVLERAGQKAGRTVIGDPAGPGPVFGVQQLVPGASVSASYSTGDVAMGGIGTVAYRDGNTVYAFGHELDGAGRRSLLLQDAYVYDVIDDPNIVSGDTSYKLAAAGHVVGTLTSDTPDAVIGQVGAPPTTIPVTVTANDLDTGNTLTEQSQVADETDVGMPLGTSLLDMIAPLQVGQAATDIYNGPPANESGRMCLTVALRESPQPLRFCNRYVGTGSPGDQAELPPGLGLLSSSDVANALTLLDQEQFATLHVTGVNARIYAQRGLHEATILSARASRRRVRQGQRVTIHLLVRQYRGPLKRLSFSIRIPRHVHGLQQVTIGDAASLGLNPSPASASLANELAQALGAPPGAASGGTPPTSISGLRSAFAAIPQYDGLLMRFGRRAPKRVYRNPNLLISGDAIVAFVVRKRR